MCCSQTSASISSLSKVDFWITQTPKRFWEGANSLYSRKVLGETSSHRCQNHVQTPVLETGGSQPWIWVLIQWEATDAHILQRIESELRELCLKPQVICRTLKIFVYSWGKTTAVRSLFFRLGSTSKPPGGLVKYRFMPPVKGLIQCIWRWSQNLKA